MSDKFSELAVEEFLRRAFDPAEVFHGEEWADVEYGGGWEKLASDVKLEKVALPARFEPPLARFHCSGCDNNWDAWVNDDGSLQDRRDRYCSCDSDGTVTLL